MANDNGGRLGQQLGIGALVAGVASLAVGLALSKRAGRSATTAASVVAQDRSQQPEEAPATNPQAPLGSAENPVVRPRGGNL